QPLPDHGSALRDRNRRLRPQQRHSEGIRLTMRFQSILLFLALCIGSLNSPSVQAADLRAFVSKQCMECHDDATRKGGLSVETLNADITTANAKVWLKMLEQLERRNMPPANANEAQPSAE